jgi:hypothetical protein
MVLKTKTWKKIFDLRPASLKQHSDTSSPCRYFFISVNKQSWIVYKSSSRNEEEKRSKKKKYLVNWFKVAKSHILAFSVRKARKYYSFWFQRNKTIFFMFNIPCIMDQFIKK